MSRVTVNIGFYFEQEHYAQLQGYIPHSQALNIPELKLQQKKTQTTDAITAKPTKALGSANRKESDDENSEIEDDDNIVPNQMQIDNEMENEDQNLMDQQQQKQMENALQMLEEELPEESQEENYDSDRLEDQEEEEDIDFESLSNQSMKNFNNNRTKRQKGESKDLIQLPDKRPRKDKKLDQANEIIRREEKQRKRKQYLKKQTQAQQKATLDKILNETGRKLRMREQKQIQQVRDRQHKTFKTLGNMPKIITLISEVGKTIMISNSKLFPDEMTTSRDVKMKETCTKCGKQSKYRLRNLQQYACSLPCYKLLRS